MSAYRYLPAAQNVAQAIPGILTEQGLDPLISRYVLTESDGATPGCLWSWMTVFL